MTVQGALGKINRLAAFFALVGLVELVGKNLHLLIALGAFADEGLEVFELLETRAMLGSGCHVCFSFF